MLHPSVATGQSLARIRAKMALSSTKRITTLTFICLAVLYSTLRIEPQQENQRLVPLSKYHEPSTVIHQEQTVSHAEPIEIAINPRSTVANDILSIRHEPTNSQVCIQFTPKSRCPHPSLVGRLSGKSITILNWENEADGYCGSYTFLENGRYFLEVLIIHCNGFGVTKIKGIKNNHPYFEGLDPNDWLRYDFSGECMEDPTRNRITGDSTYITVTDHEDTGMPIRGKWVLKDEVLYNDPNFQVMPWYTRYQPQNCREKDVDYNSPRCKVPMDNSMFSQYKFVWRESEHVWIDELDKYKRQLEISFLEYEQIALGECHNML